MNPNIPVNPPPAPPQTPPPPPPPIPTPSLSPPLSATVVMPPSPDQPPEEEKEKKEFKLLEKLLETNILMMIILGVVIIGVVVLVILGKINLSTIFTKPVSTEGSSPVVVAEPKLAAEKEIALIYINEQKIDIDKVFQASPDKLRLTITGMLKKEVFGFLPYWSVDKSDEINTKLLTSVSYFGLEVNGSGDIIKTNVDGKASEPWSRWENDPKLNIFIRNAKKNRIKVYLTLKSFDNGNIERLVRSPESVDNFVKSALYQVNSKSLDGINLDFEYSGAPSQDVIDGFSILVSNLNKELKRQYPKSTLTVDTYISAAATTTLFDVEMLAKNSDALVIMGYDFHTAESATAGSLAPMEGYGISMLGYMSSYLEKVPPEKLIIAVGYYGYDWPVADASVNSQVTGGKGDVKILPYAEIMDATQKTTINWDEKAQTPWYSYKDTGTGQVRVVHFENSRSLGLKYDFVNQKKLQGIGIWALGYDGKNNGLLQLISDKFAK